MLNRFPRPTPMNSLYPQAHPVFQGKQKERQAEPLSRLVPQRSLLHIFSCTQPAFASFCLNLFFLYCCHTDGNTNIFSHTHLSFRGIGGCAPKESAAFGCDWDFCGTQSPCLLYRETHPAGQKEKRLSDTGISAYFCAAQYRKPLFVHFGCIDRLASFQCHNVLPVPVLLP